MAIAFAREGAQVALSYLPEEQVDADAVEGLGGLDTLVNNAAHMCREHH